MTFDDGELEIALCALSRFSQELSSQMAGQGDYLQIWASAWHASKLAKSRADALIGRIEAFRAHA